jgi:hypothetical protein
MSKLLDSGNSLSYLNDMYYAPSCVQIVIASWSMLLHPVECMWGGASCRMLVYSFSFRSRVLSHWVYLDKVFNETQTVSHSH